MEKKSKSINKRDYEGENKNHQTEQPLIKLEEKLLSIEEQIKAQNDFIDTVKIRDDGWMTIKYKYGSSVSCSNKNPSFDADSLKEIKVDVPTEKLFCEEVKQDSIVDSLIDLFRERSRGGINKYNTTLDRKDLTPVQWLRHLREELMDGTLYALRLEKDLQSLMDIPNDQERGVAFRRMMNKKENNDK